MCYIENIVLSVASEVYNSIIIMNIKPGSIMSEFRCMWCDLPLISSEHGYTRYKVLTRIKANTSCIQIFKGENPKLMIIKMHSQLW